MEVQGEISIYPVLLIGSMGMLVLAIFVVLFMLIYQRRLSAQKQTLFEQEMLHQQLLLQNNIRTQEEERKRIARDLHDDIGTMLSALNLSLTHLNYPISQEQLQKTMNQGRQLVDQTIQRIRTISHDLLPQELELFGLINTLRDVCTHFTDISDIRFNFSTNLSELKCNYQTELAIYRITTELMNNTVKHSSATQASLSILTHEKNLIIAYEDNGSGFDPELAHRNNSFGLRNIENRVNMVNGTMQLYTSPGNGFKIHITLKNPVE